MLFLIKKTISPFLLPPGIFILVLALVGIWALRRKNMAVVVLAWGAGALIWMGSTSFVAGLAMRNLESGLSIPRQPEADVILMLGGGVFPDSEDFSGVGVPGPDTMARMVTAARLHRKLGIPILISGGKVFESSASIGQITKRFLVDLAVDEKNILLEERSRDTYENARFSKQLCEQHGFSRPLMVTSGYHIKRAQLSFAAVDLAVTPYPCALRTGADPSYEWFDFMPSSSAMRSVAQALHEWIGMVYYRIRYASQLA